MSGIEIAGLVLGAFPVLVSGIEGYIEGVQTIEKWWRFEKTLERLLRRLMVERVKFENTCQALFYDIANPGQLESLMKNPGGPEWRTQELQEKLRDRLGKSYEAYLEIAGDMKDVLQALNRQWGMEKNGQLAAAPVIAYKREWKKIRITLRESKNLEQLDLLRKYNADLEALLGHHSRMVGLKKTRQRIHAARYRDVRGRAESLHKALETHFSKQCGCGSAHRASIRLARQHAGLTTKRSSNEHSASTGDASCFAVLFSFDTFQPTGGACTRQWREASVEQLEVLPSNNPLPQAPGSGTTALGAPSCASNSAIPQNHPGGTPAKHSAKRVAFANMPAPPRAVERSLSASTSLARPGQSDRDIKDLCQELRNGVHSPCSLGVLTDGSLSRHRIDLTKELSLSERTQFTTLQAALKEQMLKDRPERLALGTKLAFTLLQLQFTPWMEPTWSSYDIQLLQKDQTAVQIQHALISLTFARVGRSSSDSAVSLKPRAASDTRNPAILALGLVLIELWYGKPLVEVDQPNAQQTPSATAVDLFHIATRLLDKVYLDAGEWYGDAVRRCIYCEFDQRNPSLDHDDMIEAVHRGVCEPLEDVLEAFCGGKTHVQELLC